MDAIALGMILIGLGALITGLINVWEMYVLIKTGRETNHLIQELRDDPEYGGQILSNGIHGFILELVKDPEKQKAFFGLVTLMGQHAMGAAKQAVTTAVQNKGKKIKTLGDVLGLVMDMPGIQNKITKAVGDVIGGGDETPPAGGSGGDGF